MSERWKFTPHARHRMTERGFEKTDVLTALIHPEVVYDGPPDHPSGRRVAKRGRIAVVFCPAVKLIITVLLAGIDPMPRNGATDD
jgi:hypothetical protein